MASAAKTQTPETATEEVVNTVVDEARQVGVRRYFTIAGRDPFDEIEWEIRDERDSGGGFSDPAQQSAVPPPVPTDDNESKGFFSEVLDKLGPKNADSIPVPLLVLGSIALLLMGAAGVSYLARYLQARRLDVPEPRP